VAGKPLSARASDLLEDYRARRITLDEAAGIADQMGPSTSPVVDAMRHLFPIGSRRAPDPAVVDLALKALARDDGSWAGEVLLALALRRPILATVITRAENGEPVPLDVLRPGCRVMLGTLGGRRALRSLVDGDLAPAARWLDGAVVDEDAFSATTLDVPVTDLTGLGELVDRLVRETETLPPGRARAAVADEWINEVMVDTLDDDTPYTEIVRVVGERLLESDAPALLWHAAKQLSLVAGHDRRVAERVLERCLPLARLEDARSPAAAAAPFLTVLPADRAAEMIEELAPRLDEDGWDAVAHAFLARAFRTNWQDWHEYAARWQAGSDPGLARAATSALGLADRAA
jgi:hypothetical protein